MNDCQRFEQIQLSVLLADASLRERRWAERHAEDCPDCRERTLEDGRLERAFSALGRQAPAFSIAHRRLMKAIGESRAYCGRVEGPFGPVYLARTRQGLCRVSFRRSEEDFLEELERRSLLPEFAPSRLSREIRQLHDYFAGRCRRFRVSVDLRWVSPFQRRVLEATAHIPFGKVASYSDVAKRIGRPEARRAVGGALGRNPVAIVIPCHRVISADGSIGGYTGGLDIKRQLMQIEGIALDKERS